MSTVEISAENLRKQIMTRSKLFAFACSGILCLYLFASPAYGQAKWLTQKTKPFTSGKSLAEVLEELAAAHKFKVEYADDDARKFATDEVTVFANLEGISLGTTLQLIIGSTSSRTPWIADKQTLTVQSPFGFTTVTHDVSRLGPLLRDPVEFRYAIMGAVLSEWQDPESPQNPAHGEIMELTSSTMTVRQDPATQFEIAELLDKLKAAVAGRSTTNSSDTRINKALEKPLSLPAGTKLLTEFLSETLPVNKIPYQILLDELPNDFMMTAEVKLDGEKHSLREILEPMFAEHEFQLQVRLGALIVRPIEGEGWPVEIYNVQKFLNAATGEEIAARMTEAAGESEFEYAEPLGPFIIVMASGEGHKKIAAAMSGK